MKNLFNNISESEKNRILEMHSGKKTLLKEGIQTSISDFFDGSYKLDLMSKNEQGQPFVYFMFDGTNLKVRNNNTKQDESIGGYKILSGKLSQGQMTGVIDTNKKTITLYSGKNLVGVIGPQ
jgi:hypothetical protein